MKRNLPVTGVERTYSPDEVLISETDLKGHITSANASFCAVCGFSLEELLGKPHNIVRHPDMPPEAFADLWRTIQAGERWTGLIKNRCKNGDHYWVRAFVSPIFRDGEIVGYRSVRKQPTREEIAAAEELYREIREGRAVMPDTLKALRTQIRGVAGLDTSGQMRVIAALPMVGAVTVSTLSLLDAPAAVVAGIALTGAGAATVLCYAAERQIREHLRNLADTFDALDRGDLSARAAVRGAPALARMARLLNRALDGIEVALADVSQTFAGLARGDLGRRVQTTLPGNLGRIKDAANRTADQMEATLEELNQQLDRLAKGNLSDLTERAAAAEGRFLEAQQSASRAAAQIRCLLHDLVAAMRALRSGDLTYRAAPGSGDLAVLTDDLNDAISSLADTIRVLCATAADAASASHEISTAAGDIAAGAQRQSDIVDRVVTAVERAEGGLTAITDSAAVAEAQAANTLRVIGTGQDKMAQMNQIVASIVQNSTQIEEITAAIERVAAQTNLLSVNANIEAALAGEAGKGFAVVASEVGNLAGSTADLARKISDLASQAVTHAELAWKCAQDVSSDLEQIAASAGQSLSEMDKVTHAVGRQRTDMEQMRQMAQELRDMAHSYAAATQQLTAASTEVARLAAETQQRTKTFRIG